MPVKMCPYRNHHVFAPCPFSTIPDQGAEQSQRFLNVTEVAGHVTKRRSLIGPLTIRQWPELHLDQEEYVDSS